MGKNSLFYVKLGYSWSRVNIDEKFFSDDFIRLDNNETQTNGGFNYGLGIESAFYRNWSLRAEYSYTDLPSFTTDTGTDIKAADSQFLLAMIYHIDWL